MKATFEILLQQVRIERYNARSRTHLSLMARSRQAHVRGLSDFHSVTMASHTINNAGCHETQIPRVYRKLRPDSPQTREKLRPLGCIENSDNTLFLVFIVG